MPGLPYLPWAALVAIGGVLLFMLIDATSRTQVPCAGARRAQERAVVHDQRVRHPLQHLAGFFDPHPQPAGTRS